MEIKRGIYLDKLIRKKKNGLIKVITGVRRCGKSYLLFYLFHKHLLDSGVPENHIIEVALDDRSNKALRDPDAMLRFIKENIRDDLLRKTSGIRKIIILFSMKCSIKRI